MTECIKTPLGFQVHQRRKVTADFSGGFLSSDAGDGLLLREIELRSQMGSKLANCFEDHRHQSYIEHTKEELVNQRLMGLISYWLRTSPVPPPAKVRLVPASPVCQVEPPKPVPLSPQPQIERR